jgi:hypothetical protein
VYSFKRSYSSYLKLSYPKSALALIQHTISEAVSNYSTKRLITSNTRLSLNVKIKLKKIVLVSYARYLLKGL